MRRFSAKSINTAIVLAFGAGAAALLPLQTAAPIWSDVSLDRKLIAAGSLLAYAVASALLLRRRSLSSSSSQGLLVVHASQTGVAQELAERTAAALSHAGTPTRLLALGELDAAQLMSAERVLFVVSTTGEGDAPDSAYAFVRRVLTNEIDLSDLRYGLLALGDRRYTHFCGFGRRLETWLRSNRAQALFESIEVDDGNAVALRHWQQQLTGLAGAMAPSDWTPPRYQIWKLIDRRIGNPDSQGDPVFHIALQAPPDVAADWQAGDIAEIAIRNGESVVQAFLDARGLDGATPVDIAGNIEPLRERLARSRLDLVPVAAESNDVATLAASLSPLSHREYSIASLPADGRVELLLRQRRLADGSLGAASSWLTRHAPIGGEIELRLRANGNFHAPPADHPMILIGNGTGIAGLRAHLKARIAIGARRNWLLFGERNSAQDDHYRDELESWFADGRIERLDRVFSRDAADRLYVQHRLRESANELRRWLDDAAYLYICGSVEGMAPGVDQVLRDVLGESGYESFAASGRYRRDVY